MCPVAAGILLATSGIASAASVTLVGTDVSFTYDDSQSGLDLFGTPFVTGNDIYFKPTVFKAKSTNGKGTNSTDATINVVITPNKGMALTSIATSERGDYKLNGGGSSVDVGGEILAFDTSNPFTVHDEAFITSPSDLTINDNAFHKWSAGASIDLTGAMWKNTSAINLTIENVLGATTTGFPSMAFIQKKFAGAAISVGVVPPASVPVPAALWLFGSGLLGLIGVARREQRTIA